MNADIRLSVEFFDHPKTVKLARRLGFEAVICLQRLWVWTAQNRSGGSLAACDAEDVEIVSHWGGEAGAFIQTLLDLRLLDEDAGVYSVHDWNEHQVYAAKEDERKERAKNAASKRWVSTNNASSNNILCSEHAGSMPVACPEHAGSMPVACSEHAQPMLQSNPIQEEEKNKNINTPPLPPVGGQSGLFSAFAPEQQELEQEPVPMADQAPVLEADFPDIEFLQAVDAYPAHRRDVQAAWLSWKKVKKSRQYTGLPRFFDGLTAWAESEQWDKDGGKFVPNLSNFIRKVQWMDKPPPARAAPDPYAGKNVEQILKIQDEERKRVWGTA